MFPIPTVLLLILGVLWILLWILVVLFFMWLLILDQKWCPGGLGGVEKASWRCCCQSSWKLEMLPTPLSLPYLQRCQVLDRTFCMWVECLNMHGKDQGWIIQRKTSCIVYYTYYIILCIILRIIFTHGLEIIQLKSSCIIHNTQYNTYYVLIRILYCHTLVHTPLETEATLVP